jgi:hypothetical protein
MLPCFMVSGLSALGFGPTRQRPGSLFANQLPLHFPTAIPIPFLFNHSSSLRLRRRPTARLSSLLFSSSCGHFPLQQGGTPPSFTQSVLREGPLSLFPDRDSIRSAPFPAVHPISFQSFTKCSARNSFVLTTIHFHGGCIPSQTEHVTTRTLSTHAPRLCAGACPDRVGAAIPLMMYPVPGFSAGSALRPRKRHTGIFLREAP